MLLVEDNPVNPRSVTSSLTNSAALHEDRWLNSSPGSMPSVALEHQRRIDLEEHRANVLRLRPGLALANALWVLWIFLDWLVWKYVYPINLLAFGAIRAAVFPVGIGVLWRLYQQPPPSPRMLRTLELLTFGAPAIGISIMCVPFRGFESPYFAGLVLVILARAAFLVEPWKKGLLPAAIILGSYPLALFTGSLVDEPTRAQIGDPAAMTTFALNSCFLLGSAAFVISASHLAWAMRRQIFEARNIGKYRLKQLIGCGGMGEVWAAHHAGLRRDVALKLLRADAGRELGAVRRFEQEVAATTRLTHPNTVRVFDYGVTEDGIWYYAMELLEGTDIDGLVASEGRLPPERCVHIALQAARALAEAHEAGIVHRDIKPENIYITHAGGEGDFVKVLDFGIARVAAGESGATLTRTGIVVGTPAYMSPEVAAGRRADPRSDVYGMGAVLYFMLTGAPPFESDNAAMLLVAQMNELPMRPSERAGMRLPEDLEAIVMKTLAKDPAERYANGGELAEELARCSVAGRWVPVRHDITRPRTVDKQAPTMEASVA